jgi:hypothetical protein
LPAASFSSAVSLLAKLAIEVSQMRDSRVESFFTLNFDHPFGPTFVRLEAPGFVERREVWFAREVDEADSLQKWVVAEGIHQLFTESLSFEFFGDHDVVDRCAEREVLSVSGRNRRTVRMTCRQALASG